VIKKYAVKKLVLSYGILSAILRTPKLKAPYTEKPWLKITSSMPQLIKRELFFRCVGTCF